ncbi:hypothetical protein F0L68_17405 [Solihabitans fulvus]|uniref:DUF4352 domain-containing protein n=1 Tax=Solihabitans fulvus TaxID=1892852 RepID=A0A5B2XD29_9PSEU|nr:hypothetical protein [Solihabitans fulvus]KAA2261243.1 hypothetical protein F0L68_17405 [Solihabitans fulvus]
MRIVRLAVAVCLTVVVAGCAGQQEPTASSAPNSSTSRTASGQRGESPATSGPTAFGVQRLWTNGMSITISPPKSLKPSDTAFPQAPRAALFEVTITNGTTLPYKPSQLSLRATVAGKPAQEMVDSAQGLNGVAAAGQEVPPGKASTITLAFAMPDKQVDVQVTVQPNAAAQEPSAVYEGQA